MVEEFLTVKNVVQLMLRNIALQTRFLRWRFFSQSVQFEQKFFFASGHVRYFQKFELATLHTYASFTYVKTRAETTIYSCPHLVQGRRTLR